MGRHQRGFVLKAVSWMAGLAVLAAAAIFGVNATDEELSDLARRAMAVPPPPPPLPNNGYTDFLVLDGAELDHRFKRACGPEPDRCLKLAVDNPELVKANAQADKFIAGYRAMRAKPEFVDLHETKSPDDGIPPYQYLIWGQGRSLLHAAGLATQGKLEAAVAELESENAFHRRVAAGSRSLLARMIAFVLLQRDAFFASELARISGRRTAAVLGRLEAIVRPLAKAELDVRRSLGNERAERIAWMRTRRHVRLSDDYYRITGEFGGQAVSRPWWDPVAPYLYRPHQSVNRYAAQTEILLGVADLPPTAFVAGAEAANVKARALASQGLARFFVNPVGREHPYVSAMPGTAGNADGYTPYIGRAHATQAVYTLVTLQIRLRAAGVTSLSAVDRALDGPLFKAHPDPFTGKPMRFDAKTRTIGFDSPVSFGGTLEYFRERYGRVAVELAMEN